MKASAVTIKDIAARAGVSVATVSRVINRSEQVTEETKQRVRKVIEEFDYRPNAIARSLYTKKSNVIGCILPDITNRYFAKIYLAIEQIAYKYGYTMFLCNSMNQSKLESVYLKKLVEQQVDSIIFMGGCVNDCVPKADVVEELKAAAAMCPVVVINGEIDDDRIYTVSTDEETAVDRMVHYLVQKGYRRIAMVGGAKGITVTEFKMTAFQKACLKYGLAEDDFFTCYGEFHFQGGEAIFQELRQSGRLPEALIAINDEVAAGILLACVKAGVKVPEELSVMGYDNTDLAECTYPKLTTYSHPYAKLAQFAVETIRHLYTDNAAVNRQLLRGEMIERESIGLAYSAIGAGYKK